MAGLFALLGEEANARVAPTRPRHHGRGGFWLCLTTDNIEVPYRSLAARPPTPGASGITIAVKASDERTTYRDRVSSKKNGYGMEMAPIVATNDVGRRCAPPWRKSLPPKAMS
jgi:hypothetical protein